MKYHFCLYWDHLGPTDGGDGGGGDGFPRTICVWSSPGSITPRDQISRSGNPSLRQIRSQWGWKWGNLYQNTCFIYLELCFNEMELESFCIIWKSSRSKSGIGKSWKSNNFNDPGSWKHWKTIHSNNLGSWKYWKQSTLITLWPGNTEHNPI